MIYLFQVGDVKLHLHGQRATEAGFVARSKARDALKSHRFWFQEGRFKHEVHKQSLKGLLLGDSSWTARQTLNRLKSLTDHPTEIIGYVDEDCGSIHDGCACSVPGCRIKWVSNWGIINSVSTSIREDDIATDITVEVTYGDYWMPLSPFFWRWGHYAGQTQKVKQFNGRFRDYLEPLPRCEQIFCDNGECDQFVKNLFDRPLIGYDPDEWVYESCYDSMYRQPMIAESWASNGSDQKFFIDASLWEAPPLSIYAFRNLTQSGNIIITTWYKHGVWGEDKDVSILNLDALNSSLQTAGYGGLHRDDKLFIGDVFDKPGFVVRGDQIIETPRPIVDYTKDWPGYFEPGQVRVQIETPAGVQCAYKHEYRSI